jgi:hypothetical protein
LHRLIGAKRLLAWFVLAWFKAFLISRRVISTVSRQPAGWVEPLRNPSLVVAKVMGFASLNPSCGLPSSAESAMLAANPPDLPNNTLLEPEWLPFRIGANGADDQVCLETSRHQ